MDSRILRRFKKSKDSPVDMAEAVELFMMVVCHQPYSELDKIPFMKGIQYMKTTARVVGKLMGRFGDSGSDKPNGVMPDVMSPEEYFK